MRVSVITITYDRARLIGETIASVLAQTHRDFEYLILDDGSRDDTQAVVRGFADPRIRYVRVDHVGRTSWLRQRAVELTDGEWIAFIDSDDLWLPRKLELQLARAREAGVGFCASGVTLFSDRGQRSPHQGVLGEDPLDLFDLTLRRHIVLIYPSVVLFRRQLLAAVAGFDPAMKCGEHDLFLRILAAHPATIVREPLVRIRQHPGNGSWADELGGGADSHQELLSTLERLYTEGRIGRSLLRKERAFHHYMAGSLLLRGGQTAAARRHLAASVSDAGRPEAKVAAKAALKYLYARLLPSHTVRA